VAAGKQRDQNVFDGLGLADDAPADLCAHGLGAARKGVGKIGIG
jgi:hypothetical protein